MDPNLASILAITVLISREQAKNFSAKFTMRLNSCFASRRKP
jgi:hypothetical protein